VLLELLVFKVHKVFKVPKVFRVLWVLKELQAQLVTQE
jgi:hypothetical protein